MQRKEAHLSTGRYATAEADKLLRTLSKQIARSVRSPGADEMHDLRVAIRRFTHILAVMKPCFPRDESRRLRRGLRRIMADAGRVRDQDIAMQLLARVSLPESDPLWQQIQRDRDDAAQTMGAVLRNWLQRDLSAKWRDARKSVAMREPDRRFCAAAIDATARRALPPAVADFFRYGKDAARDDASAETIHRFRIAAKKLRYSLDFFAPGRGNSLGGLADQLRDIQDLLGDINDCATVRHMLAETGGKKILAALKKRQIRKTGQFRRGYAGLLSSGEIRRQWKRAVRAE